MLDLSRDTNVLISATKSWTVRSTVLLDNRTVSSFFSDRSPSTQLRLPPDMISSGFLQLYALLLHVDVLCMRFSRKCDKVCASPASRCGMIFSCKCVTVCASPASAIRYALLLQVRHGMRFSCKCDTICASPASAIRYALLLLVRYGVRFSCKSIWYALLLQVDTVTHTLGRHGLFHYQILTFHHKALTACYFLKHTLEQN